MGEKIWESFLILRHFRITVSAIVIAKCLQRYVDESVFHYNALKWSGSERFADMFMRSIGVVRYSDVTAMVTNRYEHG